MGGVITGAVTSTKVIVLVTGVAIFVEATAMACDSVLQAHEKVQYQSVGQVVSAVVYFGLAWWWLDLGHGLMGVVWANFASRAARLVVMAPLMFWKTGPWRRARPGETAPDLRWMLRLGLPMFLATTFGIISFKVDTVMLNELAGKAATGIYVLGHRALDVLMMAPNIFATALFPALARYGLSDARVAHRQGLDRVGGIAVEQAVGQEGGGAGAAPVDRQGAGSVGQVDLEG